MSIERILVIDDELAIRKALEEQFRRKRLSVVSSQSITEAKKNLAKDDYDLVFVDVRLPDGLGTDLLEALMELPNPPLVVIITGYGTVESAVSCMRAGAFDYVIKPFSSSQIDVLLKKADNYSHLVKVNQFFRQELIQGTDLVGESGCMRNLRALIRKVAPTEATVLISGENGTGKELVANELYRSSARSQAPFIRVNCAAISESLIESEFFGHEKGAFTGALQKREGRFELANNGTILLDEISEISPKLQAKLLRVLQEKEFERVGGNKTIKVDVRVLATTNRDLTAMVEAGEFRQDLYYRLNVFPIHVEPLRQRTEDIPLLARTFLDGFSRKHGLKLRGISEEAMQALIRHDWPGNVRELQNTMERAVILSENGGWISSSALGLVSRQASASPTPRTAQPVIAPIVLESSSPPSLPAPEYSGNGYDPGEQPMALAEMEKRHILQTLKQLDGNRTQTANNLGISIRTLRNKLSQYRNEGEVIDSEEN